MIHKIIPTVDETMLKFVHFEVFYSQTSCREWSQLRSTYANVNEKNIWDSKLFPKILKHVLFDKIKSSNNIF